MACTLRCIQTTYFFPEYILERLDVPKSYAAFLSFGIPLASPISSEEVDVFWLM